jgi:hypothetical protein
LNFKLTIVRRNEDFLNKPLYSDLRVKRSEVTAKLPESFMENRPDMYSAVLQSSIHLILSHHSDLFDQKSIEILDQILNLNEKSLILLSRAIGRKFAWLRVDSFFQYLPIENDLEDVLNDLLDSNILETLESDSKLDFDYIWDASSCLQEDELKSFSRLISNGPNKGGEG